MSDNKWNNISEMFQRWREVGNCISMKLDFKLAVSPLPGR